MPVAVPGGAASLMRNQRGRLRGNWDRGLAWLLISGGAAAILVGWLQVSSAATRPDQISFLVSGGLGGLLSLGIGATLLLTADLHDLHTKTAELRSVAAAAEPRVEAPTPPGAHRSVGSVLLVTWGMAVAALGGGWVAASGASDAEGAVPGLSLGLGALLFCAGGGAVALVRLRSAVRVGQGAALPGVTAWLPPSPAASGLGRSDPPFGSGTAGAAGSVLVAEGLRYYHLPGCPALLEIDPLWRDRNALPSGLAPCGICEA